MEFDKITDGFAKVPLHGKMIYDFIGDKEGGRLLNKEFLGKFLNRFSSPNVLDLAMGTGADTISLLKDGYSVVSNEIDEDAIRVAEGEAKNNGINIVLRKVSWEALSEASEYTDGEFDVVFILGNSFPTYLLDSDDRIKALRGMWKVVKNGGVLIFDTRNWDYILQDKEMIFKNPEENFRYEYKLNYTGRDVRGFPVEINEDRVRFIWKNYARKEYAELYLWLATTHNIKQMVSSALGDVRMEVFFDCQKEKPDHYDFVQFVLYR